MSICVLIAGGGTGGHLFPGIAIAQTLQRLRPGLSAVFVSAGKALESQALARAGLPLEELPARAFRGAGLMDRVKALAVVPGAVRRARKIIKRHKPALVLAVGGYAALPLGLAAWMSRIPLAVQEQNAAPGLTNRVLSRFAKVVFTAFTAAEAHLPEDKVLFLGNPVRGDLLELAAAQQRPDPAQRFNVVVLGGSQGARSINKAVTGALELLRDLRGRVAFLHQCGQADEQWVQDAYREAGFQAEAAAFFPDVGRLYGQAHLIICRAGAGTLTEVMATGRACLCVPYPHAAGDHQTLNAQSLVRAGAALMRADAELSPQVVADEVRAMMDPALRESMEEMAAMLARPEAAEHIAAHCLEMIGEAAHV